MNRWLSIYIIALFLVTLALRITLIPYYDYNLGGIEPNVIYGIQRILQHQPLYQDPAAGSYAIIQYTPFYYYLIATLARLLSTDAFHHGLDVHALYILCRMVALVFNLLTVLICVLIIRRWGYNWRRAFVFAMPILIIVTAHYYTRGDSMQLFFFATAIWAYITFGKGRLPIAVLLSALFTAACIFTKQSGVLCAGVISCGLLFIDKRYIAALAYLLCTAILFYIGTAALIHNDWLSFYQNAVLGLKNGMDTSFLYRAFIDRHFLDMVPCYVLCGILLFQFRKVSDSTFHILLAGAAISFVFALTTGLKIGSSNNYFTEFLLFIVIGLAFVLSNKFTDAMQNVYAREQADLATFKKLPNLFRVRIKTLSVASLLILITSKTLGLFTQVCIDHSFKNDKAEYEREQNLVDYFTDVLHIQPGEHIFFTERYFLDNLFMPWSVMPTKDVITQVYAADHSTFNYSVFIAGANTGYITYIVTSEKRNDINICSDSLPFVHFDKDRFRFVGNVSGWCIYRFIPTVVMRSA